MSTPTPRTDAAWNATFDSEQMSAGRTARALREHSQQLETELAELTTERDQLRFENSNLRAGQKACEACDEPTAFEVQQLRAALAAATEECKNVRLKWHAVMGTCAAKEDAIIESDEELARLRAEVERLTDHAFDTDGTPWKTVCGWWAKKYDGLENSKAISIARAESAERELATERARLDSGQILLTVAGERVWHSGVDLRAAIDAKMKEGAK